MVTMVTMVQPVAGDKKLVVGCQGGVHDNTHVTQQILLIGQTEVVGVGVT